MRKIPGKKEKLGDQSCSSRRSVNQNVMTSPACLRFGSVKAYRGLGPRPEEDSRHC